MLRRLFKFLGYDIIKTNSQGNMAAELKSLIGEEIDLNRHSFLVPGLVYIKALAENGARFSSLEGKLLLEIRDVKYVVNSWEELFILNEVFVEGAYDLEFKDKFALIDIGMNVGITSLMFAANPLCEKIFAYEPFASTVEIAQANFRLNKNSHKIDVFNWGLGYPERLVDVQFSGALKGSVGIAGNPHVTQSGKTETKSLQIKDVYDSLTNNLKSYPGKFILKIDAEGVEYEIVDRLAQTGLVSKIDAMMIEWHQKGPLALKNTLVTNGFTVIHQPSDKKDRGMIYAIKNIN